MPHGAASAVYVPKHPQITRLADDIVESQSAEIEEMKPIAEEIGATGGPQGNAMEGMPDEGMSEMEMGDEEGLSESAVANVLGLPRSLSIVPSST